MLHIHHSNRLETLASDLLTSYAANETHPFTPRITVCESPALARWLRHQFCFNDGIICLLDTPLPATWLWGQARNLLNMPASEDPLSRERMHWLINAALAEDTCSKASSDMAAVTTYLNDDETGLKRWQLAGRIADCFDRYQYYRPELIKAWSAGEDSQWQALLWREISQNIDSHRGALIDQFIEALKTEPEADKLPQRLDLFAIHNLPQLLLNAYSAIASHIPVHLWILSPSPEYWADLAAPRELARKRLNEPENAMYWQAGNPLLTQWGRQGTAFQDMLLELNVPCTEDSRFHEPSPETMLGNLQADIYSAIDETESAPQPVTENSPTSVQIHICHSPMRECQVLRDNLLHCLNEDASLQPEDILVLVPEISRYAPYIKAVFAQGKPRIAFNLNDISVADEHPLTTAFLNLLDLPQRRFTRSEMLDFINIPEVIKNFGLDDVAASELADLFDQLHVYWGLDGAHKKSRLKLPAIDENTWHQAFQRIMAGYALGDDESWNSIAPAMQISPQKAEQTARFFSLLQTLRDWSERLDSNRTPDEWAELLDKLAHELFHHGDDEDNRLQKIHEALSELESLGRISSSPISLAVVGLWFSEQLNAQSSSQTHFYSGGITFCGMKPLRGVPFKIIALMGMQEQAFPHRKTTTEFDFMRDTWKHGDPNAVMEDRYLFLESLLAARQRLIISYTGRDIRKNDEIPPSVVVQELIDYISNRYSPNHPLLTEHPLQAFSAKNYTADESGETGRNTASFDNWWCDIARAIEPHQRPEKRQGWPGINLDLPENFSRNISVDQLSGFLMRPVRQFIQKRLKLYDAHEQTIADTEPFKLDGLQQWAMDDHFIKSWLDDHDFPDHQRLLAEGMLPHGTPGLISFAESKNKMQKLFDDLERFQPLQSALCEIDLAIENPDSWQITGNINHYYNEHGILHVTASSFKPRNLLKLWVEHLCLQVMHEKDAPSHLFSKDKKYKLKPIATELARENLKTLLGFYQLGLTTPLAFVDQPAFTYAEEINKGSDEETAKNIANAKLTSTLYGNSSFNSYDDAFYAEFILRNHAVEFDEGFCNVAEKIMTSLVEHVEKIK